MSDDRYLRKYMKYAMHDYGGGGFPENLRARVKADARADPIVVGNNNTDQQSSVNRAIAGTLSNTHIDPDPVQHNDSDLRSVRSSAYLLNRAFTAMPEPSGQKSRSQDQRSQSQDQKSQSQDPQWQSQHANSDTLYIPEYLPPQPFVRSLVVSPNSSLGNSIDLVHSRIGDGLGMSPLDPSTILCCIAVLGRGATGEVVKGIDARTGKMIVIKQIPITKRDRNSMSLSARSNVGDDSFEDNSPLKSILPTMSDLPISPYQGYFREPTDHIQAFAPRNKITRLNEELKIMESLRDNKNIIQYMGYYTTTEGTTTKIHICMEDVCGRSLQNIAEKLDGLCVGLIKIYSKQLLDALCYMHTKRILHNDIKGDNVLISNDGIVKLIDFGESEYAPDRGGVMLKPVGSPLHMSPEIYTFDSESHAPIDAEHFDKCDVWAFGMTVAGIFIGTMITPLNFPVSYSAFKSYLHDETKNTLVAAEMDDLVSDDGNDSKITTPAIANYIVNMICDNICYKLKTKFTDESGKHTFTGTSTVTSNETGTLHSTPKSFDVESFIFACISDIAGIDNRLLLFIDFVLYALEPNYDTRPTCSALLSHPFFELCDEHVNKNDVQLQFKSKQFASFSL